MPKRLDKLWMQSTRRLTRLQKKVWKSALRRAKDAWSTTGATPKKSQRKPANPRAGAQAALPRLVPAWQAQRRHLAGPGFILSYCLYKPEQGAPDGMPLLVMLHGCKQTAEDFAQGTRMNQLADKQGFAVLYPQQSTTRNATRCWRWFQPTEAAGLREADAIANLIRLLLASGSYDPSRVYVAGLSAGAGMSALVGLRHPDLVAAVALHSSPVVGAAQGAMGGLHTMRRGALREPIGLIDAVSAPALRELGLPALLLHGERDTAVGARNLRQLTAQFCHLNEVDESALAQRTVAAGTRREHRIAELRRGGRPIVTVIEMPGLEHAWSGGDAAVPYHGGHGPQASALIWRFFRQQRRELPG
ncbi:extracellular catalytic domain type 1 short-chain-length polyhydroxyalkanoate depolymerase [Verticiella sediminum]|nr:PHB depolymerase family esterase [Verticiella sediminum]